MTNTATEFDTPYKMFIAAVILASKFVEDANTMAHSIYKLVAPLYNARAINEMERSFLGKRHCSFFFLFSIIYSTFMYTSSIHANRGCEGKKKKHV